MASFNTRILETYTLAYLNYSLELEPGILYCYTFSANKGKNIELQKCRIGIGELSSSRRQIVPVLVR